MTKLDKAVAALKEIYDYNIKANPDYLGTTKVLCMIARDTLREIGEE